MLRAPTPEIPHRKFHKRERCRRDANECSGCLGDQLRAGEVTRLNLEDIDWENSRITVLGKGQRRTQFPLPADAGKAIASYLRHGRPRCASRRVFIRALAPFRGFSQGNIVSGIVKDNLARAGVVVPGRKGAHLLRQAGESTVKLGIDRNNASV